MPLSRGKALGSTLKFSRKSQERWTSVGGWHLAVWIWCLVLRSILDVASGFILLRRESPRNSAQRASVGSTEAISDQSTSVWRT
jgi:hypothetical protein